VTGRGLYVADGLLVSPSGRSRDVYKRLPNSPGRPSNATVARNSEPWGQRSAIADPPRPRGSPISSKPIGPDRDLPNYRQNRSARMRIASTSTSTRRPARVQPSPGFDLYEGARAVTRPEGPRRIPRRRRTARLTIGPAPGFSKRSLDPVRTGVETPSRILAPTHPLEGHTPVLEPSPGHAEFSVNEAELGAELTTGRAEGSVSYLYEADNPAGIRINSVTSIRRCSRSATGASPTTSSSMAGPSVARRPDWSIVTIVCASRCSIATTRPSTAPSVRRRRFCCA